MRTLRKIVLIPVIIAAVSFPFFRAYADDQLKVDRPDAVYQSVMTKQAVERRVTSWFHGFYLNGMPKEVQQKYTPEMWAREQAHYLTEAGEAGMDGPFATWSLRVVGEQGADSLFQKYGMMWPYMAHSSAVSNDARDKGAAFVGTDKMVGCWDPTYIDAASVYTERWLGLYGKSRWFSVLNGRDEPLNYACTIRNPAVVGMVNAALKKQYGVSIELSPGDMKVDWSKWPTDPHILNKPPRDVALLRIAMWRWLNQQLYPAAKHEHEIMRRLAPGKVHQAYNRNAINIRDVIDQPVRHSIDFIDQSVIYDVTDIFSADPYPTTNLNRDGKARALYHVGFVSKMVTDLAAGKPVKMILQAFKYAGITPTRDDLREWASQAAKAGATHLEWYSMGNSRFAWPEIYTESLRLARLWKDLPALDIPKSKDLAVIFSDDSRAAVNDAILHPHYTLHVLLGEKLGAWYTLVGENHVRKGLQSLEGVNVIIAPELGYVSRSFVSLLIEKVVRGATLIILDPDAIQYDIETGSLDSERLRLVGAPLGVKRDAAQIIPTPEGRKRFAGIDALPLSPGIGRAARTVALPKGAVALFTFEDGKPAVFSRSLGKGEVIFFAAMPFGNSDTALAPSGWDTLFASLLKERDVTLNQPIWRFSFPATGGEVKTFKPLVPYPVEKEN
ncbi:MAG: hypothetical protein Q8O92_10740 [Candidatus Latescibacter sp.]|nr:hypothetical protein [Candidatus Latescibacter sp.]